MTSRDFCYWLQGFFEVSGANTAPGAPREMTAAQVEMVRRHLALVFQHEIDPSAGGPKEQAALNKTHGAGGVAPDGTVYRC